MRLLEFLWRHRERHPLATRQYVNIDRPARTNYAEPGPLNAHAPHTERSRRGPYPRGCVRNARWKTKRNDRWP